MTYSNPERAGACTHHVDLQVATPPAFGLGGFSQPLSGGASTCGLMWESAPQAERPDRRMRHPSAALHHQPSKPARERIAGKVLRYRMRHIHRAALNLSPSLPATAVGACARLGACMWRAANAAGGLGERQPDWPEAGRVAPAK